MTMKSTTMNSETRSKHTPHTPTPYDVTIWSDSPRNQTDVMAARQNGGSLKFSIINHGLMSKEANEMFSLIVSLVALPALIVLGLIGSITSIVVFYQKEMRKFPINIYLAAVSASDILFLLSSLILIFARYALLVDPVAGSRFSSIAFAHFTVYASAIGLFSSTLLTMVVTIERFIAVWFPMHVKEALFSRFPFACVCISYVIAIGYTIPYVLMYETVERVNRVTKKVMIIATKTDLRLRHATFYNNYLIAANFLFTLIPVCVIMILNMAISFRIRRSREQWAKNSNNQVNQGKTVQATRTVICVNVVYLFCTIPVAVGYIVAKFNPDFGSYQKEHYLYTAYMS